MSSVNMTFGENGKIYVAEMLDYPEDPPSGKPTRSRIRILEDTNGDGKIDRSTMFGDNLGSEWREFRSRRKMSDYVCTDDEIFVTKLDRPRKYPCGLEEIIGPKLGNSLS